MGKLAIVQRLSGFGFTRSSSRAPCALASFSRARMPRSACTRDVTCELYCIYSPAWHLDTPTHWDLNDKGHDQQLLLYEPLYSIVIVIIICLTIALPLLMYPRYFCTRCNLGCSHDTQKH